MTDENVYSTSDDPLDSTPGYHHNHAGGVTAHPAAYDERGR
jgi:hypothetical protein